MEFRPEQFLAMFGGQRGWTRGPGSFVKKDDAVHIANSNDQWEWWYFDFSFDNGYKAAATLHYHNMMMIPHVPTMQLFIYPPDSHPRAKYWALKPGQENYADPDRCLVRMGPMSAEDVGDGCRLKMDMKDLAIDVVLKNQVPSWKPGSGVLWRDEQTNIESGWVVAVPRGRVEGTIRVDGRTIEVSGQGYHDHNFGDTGMENPFWGWYWGRLFDPKYTLIYGWVIPRDEKMPMVAPLMLAKGDQIVLGTDQWTMKVVESQKSEKYGHDLPIKLVLDCRGPGVSIQGGLVTNRVVEELELPRGDGAFHYYRFLAEYEAEIVVDGEKDLVRGETLHELMVLE
ncbi:MAG: hypothetical protein V1816_23960 [Pseudomonadota bacterium]